MEFVCFVFCLSSYILCKEETEFFLDKVNILNVKATLNGTPIKLNVPFHHSVELTSLKYFERF
jgi:hypothetical protein